MVGRQVGAVREAGDGHGSDHCARGGWTPGRSRSRERGAGGTLLSGKRNTLSRFHGAGNDGGTVREGGSAAGQRTARTHRRTGTRVSGQCCSVAISSGIARSRSPPSGCARWRCRGSRLRPCRPGRRGSCAVGCRRARSAVQLPMIPLGLDQGARTRRTRRIMGHMIATGPQRHSGRGQGAGPQDPSRRSGMGSGARLPRRRRWQSPPDVVGYVVGYCLQASR